MKFETNEKSAHCALSQKQNHASSMGENAI
jgi:hypothetical protein